MCILFIIMLYSYNYFPNGKGKDKERRWGPTHEEQSLRNWKMHG